MSLEEGYDQTVRKSDASPHFEMPTMDTDVPVASLREPSTESLDISDIFSVQHNYAYGWFIGRMHEGKISCMLFGQFTTEKLPPHSGWIYVGRNIECNTVAQQWEVIQGYIRADDELEYARGDKVEVVPRERYNESLKAKKGLAPGQFHVYQVAGCKFHMINGRYIPDGVINGYPVFRNVRGWTIMHASLLEIPELGIYTDACYDMNKGPSFGAMLDGRAMNSFELIASTTSTLTEGSAEFKWRFSELCRSGTRMIGADQTGQVLSNEIKRASLRNKTNEALLLAMQSKRGAPSSSASSSSRRGGSLLSQGAGEALLMSSFDDDNANDSLTFGDLAPEAPQDSLMSLTIDEGSNFDGAVCDYKVDMSYDYSELQSEQEPPKSPPKRAGSSSLERRGSLSFGDAGGNNNTTGGTNFSRSFSRSSRKSIPINRSSSPTRRDSISRSPSRPLLAGNSSTLAVDISTTGGGGTAGGADFFVDTRQSKVTTAASQSETVSSGVLVTGAELEAELTLSRKIVYQTGSQGYALTSTKGGGHVVSRTFIQEEAELSAEVTKRIESRELALQDLMVESEFCLKLYMEEMTSHDRNTAGAGNAAAALTQQQQGGSEARSRFSRRLNKALDVIEDKMNILRQTTIEVTEALGGWARLCLIEKKKQKAITENRAQRPGFGPPDVREYCVYVAFKGKPLYAPSLPVKSATRKFSRGLEPEKRAVESLFVGMYKTREEAVTAFSKAQTQIPPHNEIAAPRGSVNIFIGLRSCGKHYIVRSQGVPPDMPCEECLAAGKNRPPQSIVPAVTADLDQPFPQFVWNGKNYLEKMWSDLDFLGKNFAVQKAMTDLDLQFNPLLLRQQELAEALSELKVRHSGETAWDSLAFLRGRIEQVRDAKKASRRVRHSALSAHTVQLVASNETINSQFPVGQPYMISATESSMIFGTDSFATPSSTSSSSDNKTNRVTERNFTSFTTLGPNQQQLYNNTSPIRGGGGVTSDGLLDAGESFVSDFNNRVSQIAPAGVSGDADRKGVTWAADTNAILNENNNSSSGNSLLLPLPPPQTESIYDSMAIERLLRSLSVLGQTPSLSKDKMNPLVTSNADELAKMGKTSFAGEKLPTKKSNIFNPLGGGGGSSRRTHSSGGRSSSGLRASQSLKSIHEHGSCDDNDNNEEDYDLGGHSTGYDHDSDLGSKQQQKVVLTETTYSHRGANFIMEQYRAAPAYREEGIFCRYDEGEFASLSKGRAVRSFIHQEKIRHEGKLRAAERIRVQSQIKKALKVHFASCNVEQCRHLILRAKVLKGPVLALDVVLMEQYMAKYETVVRSCISFQRHYRGYTCRKVVNEMKDAKRREEERRRAYFRAIKETATAVVTSAAKHCIDKMVMKAVRPVQPSFKMAVHMSGRPVVVSLHVCSRNTIKGLELCASCSGALQPPRVGGIQEVHIDPSVAVKKRRRRRRRRQRQTQGEEQEQRYIPEPVTDRLPCSCLLVQSPETWLLKVADPLTRKTYTRTISTLQVRDTIINMLEQGKEMTKGMKIRNLVDGAGSFSPIEVLFDDAVFIRDDGSSESRESENSPFFARFRCSEEHSVLPLTRRTVSVPMDSIIHANDKTNASAIIREIERLKMYGPQSTSGPQVISDVFFQQRGVVPEWQWQPLADVEEAQRRLVWVKHYAGALELIWEHSKQEYRDALERLSEMQRNVDRNRFALEDARSVAHRSWCALTDADLRIKRVMKTSKANFEDTVLQELNLKENWARAWDDLDDGNEWQMLNMKRKLEPIWKKRLQEFIETIPSVEEAEAQLSEALRILATSIKIMEYNEKCLVEFLPHIPVVEAIAMNVKALTNEAARNFISTLSLPIKSMDPRKDRRVQQVPLNMVFARDPLIRTRPEYRAGWDLMGRRFLALRPTRNGFLYPHRGRSVVRAVVEVFHDPLTKFMIVHFGSGGGSGSLLSQVSSKNMGTGTGTSDQPLEESILYEDIDLDKADFASMSPAFAQDLHLEPAIIKKLIARGQFGPGAHLEKGRVIDIIPCSEVMRAVAEPCSGAKGLPREIAEPEDTLISARFTSRSRGSSLDSLDDDDDDDGDVDDDGGSISGSRVKTIGRTIVSRSRARSGHSSTSARSRTPTGHGIITKATPGSGSGSGPSSGSLVVRSATPGSKPPTPQASPSRRRHEKRTNLFVQTDLGDRDGGDNRMSTSKSSTPHTETQTQTMKQQQGQVHGHSIPSRSSTPRYNSKPTTPAAAQSKPGLGSVQLSSTDTDIDTLELAAVYADGLISHTSSSSKLGGIRSISLQDHDPAYMPTASLDSIVTGTSAASTTSIIPDTATSIVTTRSEDAPCSREPTATTTTAAARGSTPTGTVHEFPPPHEIGGSRINSKPGSRVGTGTGTGTNTGTGTKSALAVGSRSSTTHTPSRTTRRKVTIANIVSDNGEAEGEEELAGGEGSIHNSKSRSNSKSPSQSKKGASQQVVLSRKNSEFTVTDSRDSSTNKELYNLLSQQILPARKGPRPLDGIKPWKTRRQLITDTPHPPQTYQERREKEEEEIRAQANSLISLFKLQPHTLRPCLGLLHLIRRAEALGKKFGISEWYKDYVEGTPKKWSFAYISQLYYLSQRIVLASVRCTTESFEVSLDLADGSSIEISVPFPLILESMIVSQRPVLLASLLYETVLNKFSQDTLQYVLDRIDLHLPGELQYGVAAAPKLKTRRRGRPRPPPAEVTNATRMLWRQSFYNEIPTATFARVKEEAMRGPIYSCHRFISGYYCKVRTLATASSDLRFEVSAPTDGKFSSYIFKAKPMAIDLTRDELRAFVAKAAVRGDILPRRFVENMDLLHPYNMEELLNFVLGCIDFRDGVPEDRQTSSSTVDAGTPSAVKPGSLIVAEDDEDSDRDDGFREHCNELRRVGWKPSTHPTDQLRSKVLLAIRRFNAWSRRRGVKVARINKKVRTMLLQSVNSLDEEPKWRLTLRRVPPRRFELYTAVLNSSEQDLVYGEESFDKSLPTQDQPLRRSVHSLLSLHMTEAAVAGLLETVTEGRGAELSYAKKVLPVEVLLQNFYRIRVLTDESKTKIFVKVKHVGMEDNTVEIAAMAFETDFMEAEDLRSHRVSQVREQTEWLSFLETKIRGYREQLTKVLIPKLTFYERKLDHWRDDLVKSRSAVLSTIPVVVARSKESLYRLTAAALRWTEEGNSGLSQGVAVDSTAHIHVPIDPKQYPWIASCWAPRNHPPDTDSRTEPPPADTESALKYLSQLQQQLQTYLASEFSPGVSPGVDRIYVKVSSIPMKSIAAPARDGLPLFPDGKTRRSTSSYMENYRVAEYQKRRMFRDPDDWRRRRFATSTEHSNSTSTATTAATAVSSSMNKLSADSIQTATSLLTGLPVVPRGGGKAKSMESTSTDYRGVVILPALASPGISGAADAAGRHSQQQQRQQKQRTLLRTDCRFSDDGSALCFDLYDPLTQQAWRVNATTTAPAAVTSTTAATAATTAAATSTTAATAATAVGANGYYPVRIHDGSLVEDMKAITTSSTSSSSTSSTIQSNDSSQQLSAVVTAVSLATVRTQAARSIAERLVSRIMLAARTAAAVTSASEAINSCTTQLEAQIDQTSENIEFLMEHLQLETKFSSKSSIIAKYDTKNVVPQALRKVRRHSLTIAKSARFGFIHEEHRLRGVPMHVIFIPADEDEPHTILEVNSATWKSTLREYMGSKPDDDDSSGSGVGNEEEEEKEEEEEVVRTHTLSAICFSRPPPPPEEESNGKASSNNSSNNNTTTNSINPQQASQYTKKKNANPEESSSKGMSEEDKQEEAIKRVVTPNIRANLWNSEFNSNYGWTVEGSPEFENLQQRVDCETYTNVLSSSFGKEVLFGDVLMILRRPANVEKFEDLMGKFQDENMPALKYRSLQAIRYRKKTLNNYELYRNRVFTFASTFRRAFEQMHDKTGDRRWKGVYDMRVEATPYMVRILLARFYALRKICDIKAKIAGSPSIEDRLQSLEELDEAFLIDRDVALGGRDDDNLARFATLPGGSLFADNVELLRWNYALQYKDIVAPPAPEEAQPVAGGVFRDEAAAAVHLQQQKKSEAEARAAALIQSRLDLQPRIGQVVYAIYHMHCCECVKPLSMCSFPGCAHIRMQTVIKIRDQQLVPTPTTVSLAPVDNHQHAAGSGEQTVPAFDISNTAQFMPHLMGSGQHPLEVEIKRYLLTVQLDGPEVTYDADAIARAIRTAEEGGEKCDTQVALPFISSDLGCCHPAAQLGDLSQLSFQSAIAAEIAINFREAQQEAYRELLELRWKEVDREARAFRYLDRRIISPAFKTVIAGDDVAAAHPVQEQLNTTARESNRVTDEEPILRNECAVMQLRQLLPNSSASSGNREDTVARGFVARRRAEMHKASIEGPPGTNTKNSGTGTLAKNSTTGTSLAGRDREPLDLKSLHEVPLELILPMVDPSLRSLSLSPSNNAGAAKRVTAAVCEALILRLRLFRSKSAVVPTPSSSLSPIPVKPRGKKGVAQAKRPPQLPPPEPEIVLDRLYLERVVAFPDRALISIHILFGCVPKNPGPGNGITDYLQNSRIYDPSEKTVSDTSVLRLCPIHILKLLEPGITVVAYDTTSDTVSSFTLQGRALVRLADVLQVDRLDITAISRGLLDNAAVLLQLYRIDNKLVSLSLDLQPLIKLQRDAEEGRYIASTANHHHGNNDYSGIEDGTDMKPVMNNNNDNGGVISVISRGLKSVVTKHSVRRLAAANLFLVSNSSEDTGSNLLDDDEEEEGKSIL